MNGRPLAPLLAVGALVFVGCADHGSYRLAWQFVGGEPASSSCGAHGVDSVRVTGTNTAGDNENLVAVCAAGQFTHSIPVGTWTFVVRQQDATGRPISVPERDADGQVVRDADGNVTPLPDPTVSGDIVKDQTVTLTPDTVELTPQPGCQDRIDNDGDGRVDLDDPDCMGDPNTATE